MITVEKALKSKKVKNATESGVSTTSKKKVLLYGALALGAVYIGWRLFRNKKNGSENIYTPNT